MRYLIVLCTLFLFGCAGNTRLTEAVPTSWHNHNRTMQEVTEFERSGVLTTKKNRYHFNWSEKGDKTTMRIGEEKGTFYKFTFDANKVHVSGTDGIDYTVDSPETAVAQLLGFRLPLQMMKYWLRGIDSPHFVLTKRNFYPSGELAEFKQNFWEVACRDYEDGKPRRINMSRDTLNLSLTLEK